MRRRLYWLEKKLKKLPVKVFRYNSFSEAIPIFFNRLNSVFFFPCPIAMHFSPVIGYGLKFMKTNDVVLSKIDITLARINKKLLN